MAPRTALITGANRGVGLGIVKHLIQLTPPPEVVIATCRDPDRATDLKNLAAEHSSVRIQKFDLLSNLDKKSLESFAKDVEGHLEGRGLHLLINNAGLFTQDEGRDYYDLETMTNFFTVNSIGPTLIMKCLLPLLKKAADSQPDQPVSYSRACVINITSDSGSIELNTPDCYGGLYGVYRGTKAALNMLTRNHSIEHGGDNILFLGIHPGAVVTGMTVEVRSSEAGKDETWIPVEESVSGIFQVAARCTEKDQGAFLAWNGETLPW